VVQGSQVREPQVQLLLLQVQRSVMQGPQVREPQVLLLQMRRPQVLQLQLPRVQTMMREAMQPAEWLEAQQPRCSSQLLTVKKRQTRASAVRGSARDLSKHEP
jgi:hypothetical protein